jgi:predicted RNase H-like nuclease (RuvC/YqgF family)
MKRRIRGSECSNMRATAKRAREADQIIKELTCERDELEKELHEELDIKASLEEELEEIKRATGKVGGLQVIADDNRCRS